MGKWDAVNQKLSKLPPEFREGGLEYYQRVVLTSQEVKTRDVAELVRAWKTFKAEEKQLEVQAKAIRLRLRAYELLIEKTYEGSGITTLKLEDVGSLRVEPSPHAVVTDKETFHNWCIEEGLQASMNLLWQTTNSLIKERLEAGEPFHDTETGEIIPGVKAFVRTKFVPGK